METRNHLGIGSIIEKASGRDAIHIAVIPVVAGCPLAAGGKVTLAADGHAFSVEHGHMGVGVVDPFLSWRGVKEGETFWLFLYPGTIRTLRHEWSSDIFPLPNMVEVTDGAVIVAPLEERTASEQWLREFARDNFNSHRDTEESYYQKLVAGECPDVHTETTARELEGYLGDELRRHIENVSGKRMEKGYYSCWC